MLKNHTKSPIVLFEWLFSKNGLIKPYFFEGEISVFHLNFKRKKSMKNSVIFFKFFIAIFEKKYIIKFVQVILGLFGALAYVTSQ